MIISDDETRALAHEIWRLREAMGDTQGSAKGDWYTAQTLLIVGLGEFVDCQVNEKRKDFEAIDEK